MKRMSAISFAAALLLSWGAAAAPTIVSPADYATISTMSASLKSFKGTSAMVSYATYKSSTKDSATRVGYENDYMSNSQPVELHWSGTSGSCAVKVWRTHKDSASTPVFSTNVTGTSVIFYDPEVGRNYTWTVQNGGSTATGHFFTERNAPRIIRTGHDGFYLGNGRDEGGWTTSSGKVVKQGLVYRCREFEFYAPCNYEETEFYPIPYLRDNLGIKLDVDLRVKQVVIDQYMVGYPTAWNSAGLSPIAPTVPRYHSEDDCGTSFPSYAEAITDTANRIAVWHTFAKFCDASNMPILYHCSHGKDRTGTLGYILLGVLGVSRADLNIDYGLSWYAKSSWTLSSWGIDAVYNSLNSRYSSASTLAAKCEAYLKECASDAGVSAATAQNMINAYKNLMLEDPESADVNPNPGTGAPEVDAFTYKNFYFRRQAGGGTFGSNNESTGRLNYFYKSLTSDATSNRPFYSELGYDCIYYFWPTPSLPYACPVCGYYKTGKIVTSALTAASDRPVGPYNFKAYFTSDGHTVADRTIIEHRGGVADYENVDLYFTVYDEANLGEKNLSAAYVYSGTAAIEVWANATMRVRDIRDMSQKHKSSVQYKAYVKFPENNCDNARFEALETDTGDVNLLGWFTGGQAGTTQHLKVGNTRLQFNASGKTSGVAGALVLDFELGSANTTATAAMLHIAGSMKLNAGSSIVVDAGGKGAGTYKLINVAGTLTDNAGLTTHYQVTNCANGYYGTITKSSNGKIVYLKIQAGEDPGQQGGGSQGDVAISASASYLTYPNPKFVVAGTVAMGAGATTATLHYALNGGAEQTQALTLASGGSFSAEIPYAAAGDTLVWHVTAQNVNGGVTTAGSTASTTTSRAADSAATTYVWTGAAGDGKWTTLGNWTNTSATAYGYPANGTYATAEFPVSLTNAFTCTVDQNVAVKSLHVYSPNIRFVLDDKTLTVNGTAGSYTSYAFGNVLDGNPSIELSGAGAAIVSAASTVRANYGYITDEGAANGVCTVKYVVPASGWTTTAPIRASASDSKVLFYPNVRLVVDATALGVPTKGVTKTVYLASGTDAPGVYQEGTCVVTCAPGARGSVAVSNNKLVLSVTASGEPVTTTEIDPPTVDIPSGSAFTANGAVQKPAVSPATAVGYTVDWGATDWTSAGTHTLTITPNYGYAWTGGSTAPITYTYTFSTITYTPYYFGKSNNLSGRYQSSSKWYTSSAYTTAIAYPDAYTAHNVATVPSGSAGSLVMDGQLVAKAGKFTANGNFTLGYGTLQFQNNTVTPVPLWTTESGVSRIKSQNIELSGIGTGYFDIHANASNVLSTVSASAGVFVRFNTSNAAGATLVVDSEDSAGLTTLGWFEGGTAATTPRLVADGACVSFAKADAVSGVAGPLAIAVTLGEHNTNATPISVAGTLNVNAGSTLAVNASSIPAGTYAILSAGTLNDSANLAANGVVTGLGEDLAGSFVRSENAIRLVISPEAPDDPTPVLTEIAVPAARTGLVYDGAEKTGVLPGTGYTLADNVETGAGDYTATATLDEGYCWTGGSTDPAAIAWSIAKAQNAWTAEPAITKATWAVDEEAGVLTPAATQFGAPSATIAKDGGAAETFAGTLPTAVGSYVITFTSDATANWLAPTPAAKTLAFSIVAPDPGTFAVTLFNEHPEWGYKVEGLGAAHDEVALVFTNQAATASWMLPDDIENVQFLVVGGGGGGGADLKATDVRQAGAGGGGGGVVTGVVAQVAKDAVLTVSVGAGGAGGVLAVTRNGNYGAAIDGAASSFSIGGVTYVTALGGGADRGSPTQGAAGNAGGAGGSSAGSRPGSGAQTAAADTSSCINAAALSNIPAYGVLGNRGGAGSTVIASDYYFNAGGGGGATEPGGDASIFNGSNWDAAFWGGKGGEGLASDITGTTAVYGSGGGGGSAAADEPKGRRGGTGAGDGNVVTDSDSGTDALPNQGGGGGGGGRLANGGKGGSGIVVLRFRVPGTEPPVVVPDLAVVTNALSTASWGYTVSHLGEFHNETAVVVTNGTATWTAPAALENVRFLVVGGGGGGGGDVNAGDGYQGGAGGGGGGVVTGVVYSIAENASVVMTVGAGGAGGTAGTAVSSKYGAGKAGSASTLKVGGVTYVTANGGGQDQGSTGKYSSGGQAGGNGGSSAGSRPKVTTRGNATKGSIGSGVASLLSAELFGNQGGASSYSYSAGGGGGATEEGGMPPDSLYGGDGGEGLASDITGEVAVYGSGGGGGNCRSSQPYCGGVGGTNAGDGNPVAGANGENAVANRGGGGGGGGGQANGGSGGSGIVVLRYVATSGVIVEAEVSALVQSPEFTGATVSCGLAETAGYTVSGAAATEVGNYTATVTPKAGYVWDDGTAAAKTFSWSVTEPEPQLIEVAVPTAVTGLMYTGADQTGVPDGEGYTLSDAVASSAGDHTATATLVTGYCWIGGSTDPVQIPWSIAKTQNMWTTEPSISKATWATDETPGELTPAATFLGTPEASISKDNGQSVYFDGTLPTEVGSYVVTYFSGDEENWWGPLVGAVSVSFSITAPVVPVPQPIEVALFDEHPEWGYKVEGLGVAHDETALVFTNQNASSMAWTVPADLADVQFLVVGGGGGGGADYNPGSGSAPFLGGGGGGGGGVVTGVVSTVVADTEFSIKVGAGGAGGICNKTQVNGGFGASYAGLDSTVSLGGVAVLTAFGGGNDKGTTSSSAKSGRVGGTGGSNAGSRGGYGTAQGAPTRGSVAASFASQLAGYGVLGNVGGSGNTGEQYWGYYSASGGGGGATTAGGTPTDYSTGGTGGEGLASDITGTLRVYGSGGGGGTISGNLGGAGGTGAGSGNIDTGNGGSGQDALANQGGGGGGGGRSGNGGKGGSGIVVLRFRVPSAASAMPSVAGEVVAPAEIFTKAREAKSIVYPSEPTLTGDVGAQVISFGGVDVNVPDYYTASKSGNVVTLSLNDNAKPVITDEDETPGIAIVDGKVHIHLGNVKSALYYTILTATSLDSGDWTPCGAAEQGQDDFEFNASGATRFYKASVRDEAE